MKPVGIFFFKTDNITGFLRKNVKIGWEKGKACDVVGSKNPTLS